MTSSFIRSLCLAQTTAESSTFPTNTERGTRSITHYYFRAETLTAGTKADGSERLLALTIRPLALAGSK